MSTRQDAYPGERPSGVQIEPGLKPRGRRCGVARSRPRISWCLKNRGVASAARLHRCPGLAGRRPVS
jgi:hypothetical protein